MPNAARCPCCSFPLDRPAPAARAAEPTMAELLAELKAIRSEVAAIRAETFNLVASAPSFALLNVCEAVMSGGHPFVPK